MKPTDEQQHAIDTAVAGHSLVLEAMAGSGKSSTLKMIAKALPSRQRLLYTAFSAQVIADAKAGGFPPNVQVRSNHSLAYSGFGAKYRDAGRMERRLTPRVVVDCLSLADRSMPASLRPDACAHLALEAVLRFQQSAAQELIRDHVKLPGGLVLDRDEAAAVVFKTANAIWSHLSDIDKAMPITHDTYLKLWALSDPQLRFDTILLDEAQDANGVVVDILTRQETQMIVVGDRRQQIFSWRGAESAMQSFPIEHHAWLTQSFRFGSKIAAAANTVLLAHARSDMRVRGNPAIADRIGEFTGIKGQRTVIARTNSALIGQIAGARGKVAVVGGVTDLLKLVEGAELLKVGKLALGCMDLADFSKWGEVEDYAKSESGRDLAVLVRLINDYGIERLKKTLRGVAGNEKDEGSCDLILTTAHRSKGREWDRVTILDDFPTPTDQDLGRAVPGAPAEKSKWNPEEANLLYVAITRAKKTIDIEGLSAWLDAVGVCVEDGIEVPGVTDDPRFNDELPDATSDPEEALISQEVEVTEAEQLEMLKDAAIAALYLALHDQHPADSATFAAELFVPAGADAADYFREVLSRHA